MALQSSSNSLFILSLYTSIVISVHAGCPTGWSEYSSRCYRVEVREWVSYTEAVRGCSRRGAVLAGIPDQTAAQFIVGITNASWSQINDCRLQARDCLLSTLDSKVRWCSEQPCLGFWVGLARPTPCGSSCALDTIRQGWQWLDGSPYSPTTTPWANQQPVDDRLSIRFAVQDNTMTMTMASYDETWRYGYICSRSISSTDNPGPEYPDEGSRNYNIDYQDDTSNVTLGLAIGLSVGGALLIIIIACFIFIIRDCCCQPDNKKMRRMQEDGASDSIDMRDTKPVYFANKRNTVFWSENMDPYKLEPTNDYDANLPEGTLPETYA